MGVKGKKSRRNNKKKTTGRAHTASTLFRNYKSRGMNDERAIEFVAIGLAATQTEVAKMLKSTEIEISPDPPD